MTSSPCIKIEEIRGDVIKMLKEAIFTKSKGCIDWSNQADCGGETCVKILREDDQSITFELKNYGGCSGGVSFVIVMTIPKQVVEEILKGDIQ